MFDRRVKEVRQKLSKEKLDAVLVSDVSNIIYLTGFSNFSQNEREAYLVITKDEQIIITDARYSEAIKEKVPHFDLFERSSKTPAEKLFKELVKKIEVLGIEEDELTVAEHRLLTKYFKKIKHMDLKKHRAVKTAEEIEKIERASRLGDLAFEYILTRIKEGISEKELAFELEIFIKKNKADLSFPSIVAFGKNSAVPHHQTSDKRLTINDKLILMDFGVKLENYCSDMTRTVFFGKPSEKQKKIYEVVSEAQQKAIDFININIKKGRKIYASQADKAARDYIVSKGYPTIPHSLGHGIGLKVHEYPSLSPKSKEILKEGMVFSIEPGIYLPDFGGVRIEDLYVLEKNNLKQMAISSKKIIVI